jgi:hypothetical protein
MLIPKKNRREVYKYLFKGEAPWHPLLPSHLQIKQFTLQSVILWLYRKMVA